MKRLETILQKSDKAPSKFIFETVKYRRGLINTPQELSKYRREVAGEEGESIVLNYLEKYGKKHWCIIQNLWMNHFGPFECDVLLMTSYKIYILEIKNYFGEFSYKDGIVMIDDVQRNINPIHQASRNYQNVKELLKQIFPNFPIEGALIFTGIDNPISIESEIPEIEIIPRAYLKSYIKKIIEEEDARKGTYLNSKEVLAYLESFEIKNDFSPAPATNEQLAATRKGIYCANCNSYEIIIRKLQITCTCGYVESKEKAVLRTILDYGILNYESHLKIQELVTFFDDQISRSFIKKILKKYFAHIIKGPYSYYKNQVMEYKEIISKS